MKRLIAPAPLGATFAICLGLMGSAGAQQTQQAAAPEAEPVVAAADSETTPALAPFTATYEAWHGGKLAGSASMTVSHNSGPQWRIDLGIRGNRGFAGVLGLNLQQSTVFEVLNDQFRPISQSTVRKGIFLGKKFSGVYDWRTRTAQWHGEIKEKHSHPIELQDGDMSGLLINLAVIRDAQPGKQLAYRYVDGGRAREHVYQVADQTENVAVADMSYDAMRVSRVNGGNDETIFWIAKGVPTPVRILQREDGEDSIDLRLIEYQGTEQ